MSFNNNLTFVLLKTTEGKIIFKPFGLHKLLLAVFGFFLDGSRGFIVGFIVGCFFDAAYIRKQTTKKQIDQRLNFLMLGAFILQTTGLQYAFSDTILRSRLIEQFGLPYIENRLNFFRELLNQRIQVESISNHIKTEATEAEKIKLFHFLFQLSAHPETNTQKLMRSMFYIATKIEFDPDQLNNIRSQYTQHKKSSPPKNYTHATSKPADHYALFDLTYNCTEKQLKKAYYKLAKKYHPDSNPHATEKEQKTMQEKLRNVIEKYEMIKEERGWK